MVNQFQLGQPVTQVALFPIPNCVLFPGTVFPLHVFEPRYRSMIKDCLENNIPVAVCDTEKVLHQIEPMTDLRKSLHSNQSTYKPKSIFSAGQCELHRTLKDGRLFINVHASKRYQLKEIVQTLPYNIAKCEELPDEPLDDNQQQDLEQLKDKVMHRLLALSANDEDVQKVLHSEEWESMSPESFSFAVFGLVEMPPDIQQNLLENTQPVDRLDTLLNLLNQDT